MKKTDGHDYKETCIKTIWKLVQKKDFDNFGTFLSLFVDILLKKYFMHVISSEENFQKTQAKRKKVHYF